MSKIVKLIHEKISNGSQVNVGCIGCIGRPTHQISPECWATEPLPIYSIQIMKFSTFQKIESFDSFPKVTFIRPNSDLTTVYTLGLPKIIWCRFSKSESLIPHGGLFLNIANDWYSWFTINSNKMLRIGPTDLEGLVNGVFSIEVSFDDSTRPIIITLRSGHRTSVEDLFMIINECQLCCR